MAASLISFIVRKPRNQNCNIQNNNCPDAKFVCMYSDMHHNNSRGSNMIQQTHQICFISAIILNDLSRPTIYTPTVH